MKYFTFGVALFFCMSSANLAKAGAIYDFSLAANGAVSAFDIQLTFPDLLQPGGLLVIPVTSSVVTSLSFAMPGFTPGLSVIGLEITPLSTLFGVSLRDAANSPLLFTNLADSLCFDRTPHVRDLLVRFWQSRQRPAVGHQQPGQHDECDRRRLCSGAFDHPTVGVRRVLCCGDATLEESRLRRSRAPNLTLSARLFSLRM